MRTICEKSLSGKVWTTGDLEGGDIIDKVLAERGIVGGDAKRIFLNPSLREQMPDPFVLSGMDAAVKIAANAIGAGKKIAIFGDYDVDGITSTAILIKFLRAVGADVAWHLPDREVEGYGLNEQAVRDFATVGANLLIAVDCGITATAEIAVAKSLGMETIIADHHEPAAGLPAADAIVNPKQPSDRSGQTYLAGVGVAFMFLIALNRELGHPVSDMMKFLDLVALGTICDTMPLVGLNRAIASSGLKILERRDNLGLKVLMDVAGVKKVDAYSAGFIIGPRLNAAGRIMDANLALDLIMTDNYLKASELAGTLNEMNAKRMSIQSAILIDADEIARRQADEGRFGLYVAGDNWHGGVMGIIAGRLKDKYNLPCCVATRSGGVIGGSGRSVPGVDLGKIIGEALERGIITAGGGHAVAVGFDLPVGNEQKFMDFLNDSAKAEFGGLRPSARIDIDSELDAAGADMDLAKKIQGLAPFGVGNAEPVLCLSNGIWTYGRTMGAGGAHLSGTLKTGAGTLAVVGFDMTDTAVGKFLLDSANFGCKIKAVGKLRENNFSGGVQLFLEDVSL